MRDKFEDQIADVILSSLRAKAARESVSEVKPEDARLIGGVVLEPSGWPVRTEILRTDEQLQHRADDWLDLPSQLV